MISSKYIEKIYMTSNNYNKEVYMTSNNYNKKVYMISKIFTHTAYNAVSRIMSLIIFFINNFCNRKLILLEYCNKVSILGYYAQIDLLNTFDTLLCSCYHFIIL